MKEFVRVLIWVAVLGGILFGVYTVLPEYPHNYVKALVQPVVNAQAKKRILQVKNLKNEEMDALYQNILEKNTRNTCWVYEEGVGIETVTFYGSGATINIKDLENHDNHLYTSTLVKFEFVITGNSVDITAYIENQAQDDEVKELMIQQLYQGR